MPNVRLVDVSWSLFDRHCLNESIQSSIETSGTLCQCSIRDFCAVTMVGEYGKEGNYSPVPLTHVRTMALTSSHDSCSETPRQAQACASDVCDVARVQMCIND